MQFIGLLIYCNVVAVRFGSLVPTTDLCIL